MKLILIRHAKSSWDDFTLDDHDRGLTDKGRVAVETVGKWLASEGHVPDIVLCSSARRAQETLAGICDAAGIAPDTRVEEGLYHASSDRIIRHIHKCANGTMMVVGHNPGFADLAGRLTNRPPDRAEFHTFPTASTLVLEFDISTWRDLKIGRGSVVAFVTPRDLAE